MVQSESTLEITLRGIFLSIFLTILLSASNAFLALKLGMLTSASIPAAILSMGILRFFKNATVLENNAIQTAASAGEAVAGGIVYTIPGLIIIQYWHHFDYWTNFWIAFLGGVLGVLFSIPLRKTLVNDPALRFPEGQAIAEVLKSSQDKTGFRDLLFGGLIGSVLELFQMGFKVVASTWNHWFSYRHVVFGAGVGFSPTMIGAGFLIGQDMAVSIALGAGITWLIALPLTSSMHPELFHLAPTEIVNTLWSTDLRYLGIGAMLFAGIWTFIQLVKPLWLSIRHSLLGPQAPLKMTHRTEKDLPKFWIISGVILVAMALYYLFHTLFPENLLGMNTHQTMGLNGVIVAYILFAGFIFSIITAYFSGMVGVTASPGSSVVIAGILFAATILLYYCQHWVLQVFSENQLKIMEAMTITIGSIVTGIAAIANDNSQDLKVGQLVGATPWKQQLMLLLGVLVASLVIPAVMQILYDVYGIANQMPHSGMDISQSLPAPTAALLAAISVGIFHQALPWAVMGYGVLAILGLMLIARFLKFTQKGFRLSILGVAVGMYLPLTSSMALLIGGVFAHWVFARASKVHDTNRTEQTDTKRMGTLIACGLVAGSALMDVLLAMIFSISHQANVLSLVGDSWFPNDIFLAWIVFGYLGYVMIKRLRKRNTA